jgi:hypothetical protein
MMRTKIRAALCAVAVIVVTLGTSACARLAGERAIESSTVGYEESFDSSDDFDEGTGGRAPLAPSSGEADVDRLMVRNGSLEIVVADTQQALDAIIALADDLEGFVLSSELSQYQEGLRAHIQVRIPAGSFEDGLQRIRDLATEVRRESTSASDVTEEYVDLQSNLRNREATQARLLEYLEDAEDTEAALAVDEHLRIIEAEIEQLKGRIQYLEQSAAMATIRVDITPDELAQPIEVGGWRPEGTLRDAFEALVRVLQFLVDALIVLVVLVIPALAAIAAPIAAVVYVVRGIVRRRRRKSD